MITILKKICLVLFLSMISICFVACNTDKTTSEITKPSSTTEENTDTTTEEVTTNTTTTNITTEEVTTNLTTTTPTGVNYEIENGGFEQGSLIGWTIVEGNAFSNEGMTSDSMVNETIAFHKDGTYLYGIDEESATGQLRSSDFVIGGSGYISFKLGAGYNEGLTYISIVESNSNRELYRFGNSAFDTDNYDSYNVSNDEAMLRGYFADLSDSMGKEVYILIVDNSTQFYGYVTFDSFNTYYENMALVPDYIEAIDIAPVFTTSTETPYTLENIDFSLGTLSGWTVVGENNSFLDSHVNLDYRLSNRPNESSVGLLRSSAFKVGGEHLFSFRLGATKHSNVTYLSVKLVGTNEEIFRTYSNRWKDSDEEATHLYFVDLAKYAKQSVYLEFVDNSRSDWGLLTIEDIITFYDTVPNVIDEIAVNILDEINVNPEYLEMREYVDDLITKINDELERETLRKTFYSTLDGITNSKGNWPSVVQYNDNATTFIYTGDIYAMWLRDSSAQVLPYLQFMNMDNDVAVMVKGLLKLQFEFIRRDPYANAFNDNGSTFERKFEIDSLCYPIWLAYEYYTITGDDSIFDAFFRSTIDTIMDTLRAEQTHSDDNYRISNTNDRNVGSHDVNLNSGLIWTGYRPSDDVAYYKYNIPENMFAVATLEKIASIYSDMNFDVETQTQALAMALEVRTAIETYGTYNHPTYGKIYVYETTGYNNDINSADAKLLMDIANIPSLLSAPWLGFCEDDELTYLNTRNFILSTDNPYYYEGTYASGIGDPHDMIGSTNNPHPDTPVPWHMSIAMQAITTKNQTEINLCIDYMINTTAGTYVMHEAFNADNPGDYSRDFFTWPCSLYAYAYITKILKINLNE